MSILRLLFFVSAMGFTVASWAVASLPKSYCMKIDGTSMDGNGVNYAQLTQVTSTDVKLTFSEGLLNGKSLQGPTSGSPATSALLAISADELWGTAASGSPDTRFVLDMSDSTLKTIKFSSYNGEFIMTGTEGACDIDFNAKYCAHLNSIAGNFQYEFSLTESSTGALAGTVQKYPAGAVSTFVPTLSSGGLKLATTTSASETIALEFSKTGLRGTYQLGSGPVYKIKGIKDPIGGGGCSNILMNGEEGEYNRSTPTIVGSSIYIGTGSGNNHPVLSQNALVKVNSLTMLTSWRKNLGTSEVIGSPVLDSSNNIYVVVQDGRTRDLSTWDPQGVVSSATWKLLKFNNPPSTAPTLQWSKTILSANAETPTQGQLSPAVVTVDGNELIFVGGDAMRAFNTSGSVAWTYTYSSTTCDHGFFAMGSPIVSVTSNTVFFNSTCGIHGVHPITGLEQWSTIEKSASAGSETYGSPQWARVGTTVYGVYVPMGNDLYCINPSTGGNCAGWAGSTSATPIKACVITPSSISAAPIRGGPLLDSAGNIYIGTKASSDALGADGMMKIAANCSSTVPTWELASGSDLYPTGVLNSGGQWIVANENRTTVNKTVNVFSTTSTSTTPVATYDLEGDPGFPGLRLFNDGTNNRLLVATEGGSPEFIPGLLYSIKQTYGYDTAAKNNTSRGANSNTGK